MSKLNIIYKPIEELKPYKNNPRINKQAVQPVADSIQIFGFKVPIIIDKDNIIVAGHTRYLAAKQLDIKELPCIIANDLTPEQIKAFRLVDNKVAEKSSWDFDLLNLELKELDDFIDMSELGFELFSMDNADQDYSNFEDVANKKNVIICPECGAEIEK